MVELLPLKFPAALRVEGAGLWQRRLCFAGHFCLFFNGATVLVGLLPVAGLLAAGLCFGTARLVADAAGLGAIRFGLGRIVLALCLLFLCFLVIQWEPWPLPAPNLVWLLVPLVQMPLAMADARAVWRGEVGWKITGNDRF